MDISCFQIKIFVRFLSTARYFYVRCKNATNALMPPPFSFGSVVVRIWAEEKLSTVEEVLPEVEKLFVELEASEAGLERHRAELGAGVSVSLPVPVVTLRSRFRISDRLDLVDVLERVALVAGSGQGLDRLLLLLLLILVKLWLLRSCQRVPGLGRESLK